jgi:hypothetical protein
MRQMHGAGALAMPCVTCIDLDTPQLHVRHICSMLSKHVPLCAACSTFHLCPRLYIHCTQEQEYNRMPRRARLLLALIGSGHGVCISRLPLPAKTGTGTTKPSYLSIASRASPAPAREYCKLPAPRRRQSTEEGKTLWLGCPGHLLCPLRRAGPRRRPCRHPAVD